MDTRLGNEHQSQVMGQLGSLEACLYLLEYCPSLMWASGTDGEYIYLNQAWLQFTGRTLKQELKRGWTTDIHPHDREMVAAAYQSAFQARQPLEVEYRRQRQDGEYRWLIHTGQPWFDPVGHFAGYVGNCIDITDRKQRELELVEHNERHRAVLAAIPDLIDLVDADGILCDLVAPNYPMSLIPPGVNYINCPLVDLIPLEVANRKLEAIQHTLQIQQIHTYEQTIEINGQQEYEEVRCVPMEDNRVLSLVRNISDRKRAESTLQLREAQFRAIFEHAGVGIITSLPPDYGMTMTNPFFQSLVGYSAAELQQISEQQITHPDDLEREQQLMQDCMASQQEYCQLEKRYVCKDGQIIWASVGKSILRDQAGQVQQIIATVEDVTERKRAVDLEIDRNRRLKEAIFEEVTDAVFLVDARTRLTINCNSRAIELFEAESKLDLIGYEGNDLQVRPFSETELTAIREEVNRDGFSVQEVEYRTKHGRTFWGRLSVKFLEIADFMLFLVQVSDISDRKQAELDMIRNMEELRRLNLSKDDFLSTVSHELRTPLTSIKMASKMLSLQLNQPKENMDWQRIQSYLQILEEQCQQEDALINDLLDLQRLKVNTYALNLTLITLQDWLPPILRGFEERIEQHQQQLQVVLSADFPALTSDPVPLRRIIVELLNNACKYTPDGEQIVIKVRLLPRAGSSTAQLFQLSICNSGVEISSADQPHIFEPFYRAHKGDRWAKAGTGLGLALVQQLVHELKGTIECRSGSVEVTDEGTQQRRDNCSSGSASCADDQAVTDQPAVETCFIMVFPLHIESD
ncbi:MAG: PAS domain-containing sensor histidine kinase [Thainema sp.]